MARGSADVRSRPFGGYPVLYCRPPKGSMRTGFPQRVGIEYASWRAQSGRALTSEPTTRPMGRLTGKVTGPATGASSAGGTP